MRTSGKLVAAIAVPGPSAASVDHVIVAFVLCKDGVPKAGAHQSHGGQQHVEHPDWSRRLLALLRGRFEAAWSERDFRRWFLAVATNSQTNQTVTMAQIVLLGRMGAGAAEFGLLGAVQTLPMLLLVPFMGVVGDRVSKRRLLLIVARLQMVPPALLAVLVVLGCIHDARLVVIVALAGAALKSFIATPGIAFTTLLLDDDDEAVRRSRQEARSRLNVLSEACAKCGTPLLAAAAIEGLRGGDVGLMICLAASSAAFGYQIVVLRRTPDVAEATPRREHLPKRSALRELLEVVHHVRERRAVWYALVAETIVSLFAFNINTLAPALVFALWQGRTSVLAWLLGAFGAGQLIGGLRRFEPKARSRDTTRDEAQLGRLLAAGLALACVMLAALLPHLAVQLPAFALMGFATATIAKTVEYELNVLGRRDNVGRITALQMLAYTGTTAIGAPLVGFIMDARGVAAGFVIGAIGAAIGAVILAYAKLTHRRTA